MRATTNLHVRDDMRVTVKLEMTIQEMRAILKLLQGESAWPSTDLRIALNQSVSAAEAAYTSEQTTHP